MNQHVTTNILPTSETETTAATSILHCVAYSLLTGLKVREIPLDDVSDVLDKNTDLFVWIGLYEPTKETMQQVQAEFGLHELAVEDSMRPHQRAKVENYNDIEFVVVRTAQLMGSEIKFGMTSVFLGQRFLISVRQGASSGYQGVREQCERVPNKMKMGPGFVLYSILDFVVDNFLPITDQLGNKLKDLESDIFSERFNKNTLRVLYDLKSQLVKLRLAVGPLHDICSYFLYQDREELAAHFPATAAPYFRDINDHLLRTIDAIDAHSEMLRMGMDTYLALVGVGQNDIVKRLASWAGILAVPTMIASFYGMNFENMPELHWHYGYYIALFVMFALTFVLYRRLRRARWL